MSAGSEVIKDVEARYRARTKKSREYYLEAKEYMPGGETRESISYKPYTTNMARGKGFRLWDILCRRCSWRLVMKP